MKFIFNRPNDVKTKDWAARQNDLVTRNERPMEKSMWYQITTVWSAYLTAGGLQSLVQNGRINQHFSENYTEGSAKGGRVLWMLWNLVLL